MKGNVNRRIFLVEKPTGKLRPENFRLLEEPLPKPGDGEALIRVRYISLDAANRAWMQGATYRADRSSRRRKPRKAHDQSMSLAAGGSCPRTAPQTL
jgi:hypothetical protein